MTRNRAKLFAAVLAVGGLAAGGAPAQRPGTPVAGPPATGAAGTGGNATAARPVPAWEHRFVELRNDDRDAFELAVRENGKQGWEYCGSERLRRGGNPPQIVLTFKRPAGRAAGGPAPGGSPPAGSMPGSPVRAGGFRLNVFPLKNADATLTASVLQKLFNPDVVIVPDARTNSLVVRADEHTLELIRTLIARLDSMDGPDLGPPKKRP
jgi:type II secretory pathway component GspD/PulD (secretin)